MLFGRLASDSHPWSVFCRSSGDSQLMSIASDDSEPDLSANVDSPHSFSDVIDESVKEVKDSDYQLGTSGIDEYLKSFDERSLAKLVELRQLIKDSTLFGDVITHQTTDVSLLRLERNCIESDESGCFISSRKETNYTSPA